MTKRKPGDWWDLSWSVVSGCTPAGDGCNHCWATAMAKRFEHVHCVGKPFSEVFCHHDRIRTIKRARDAKVWAVSLLGDLFHEQVPYEFVDAVLDEARHVNWDRSTQKAPKPEHRFVLLTKRYRRAVECINLWVIESEIYTHNSVLDGYIKDGFILMFSVWDHLSAKSACRAAMNLPAGFRFGLHIEPMLGAIELDFTCVLCGYSETDRAIHGDHHICEGFIPPKPSWIVIGGEKGPGARPMHRCWVRKIRDQCGEIGIPFWFKGWGGKRQHRIIDGTEYNQTPWIAPEKD